MTRVRDFGWYIVLLKLDFQVTKGGGMKMLGPAYTIQTNRLLIKCYEPQDAFLLKAAIDESIDHLSQWLPWAKNEPEEVEKKIQRIRRYRAAFDLDENYVYGIFLPDKSRLVGVIASKRSIGDKAREIGYWLHKDYVNKGYATEAGSALIKVAFEVDRVERIEIHCDNRNIKSSAIPRKLGFSREAVIRLNDREDDGERKRDEIWVLFEDEYRKTGLSNFEVKAFDVVGRKIL